MEKSMQEIKAFIFDMDGVILDSETICDKAWLEVAKKQNLPNPQDVMKQCLGTNKNDTIQILKKNYGADFDSEYFIQQTSDYFHQIEFSSGIPLMPFAKEILDYLKPKYRIALASSTRKATVERQLKAVGVLDYFETLTCGDMVEHSKPNPEIYLMACKSLGLKPEECVAIEDSPNGIKSAFAANLHTIMIPDKIQPTEEIKKMCERILLSLEQIKSFY